MDNLLALLHPGDVVLQAGQLISRLGGVGPAELCELVAVLAVLADSKQNLAKSSLFSAISLATWSLHRNMQFSFWGSSVGHGVV